MSGDTETEQTSTQKAESGPWKPTVPLLQNFLGRVQGAANAGTFGATPDQTTAFEQLKSNAASGYPTAGALQGFAGDVSSAPSRAGQVGDAYSTLQQQLGPTASGSFLDFENNPYVSKTLDFVGNDVQDRINSMFAGAGRDLSGINQQAVARGVSQAQTPLLLDLLQQQQGRQMDAAGTLFNAGLQAPQAQAGLDASRLGLLTGAGDAAAAAQDYGPSQVLNLEQQQKELPYGDLGMLGNLLLPVAGLGGTTSGTTNQVQTQSQNPGIGQIAGAGLGGIGLLGKMGLFGKTAQLGFL